MDLYERPPSFASYWARYVFRPLPQTAKHVRQVRRAFLNTTVFIQILTSQLHVYISVH